MSSHDDTKPRASAPAHALIRHGPVTRMEQGEPACVADDALAVEAPLELRIDGVTTAILMRTPGHDRELVLGWLRAEGVLEEAAEAQLTLRPDRADVVLTPAARERGSTSQRLLITTSACGVCSHTQLAHIVERFGRAPSGVERCRFSQERLLSLPERLRAAQRAFQHTGGLHAAALCTAAGEVVICREDVGRHNAADKVVGCALEQRRLPARGHVLLLSGRASYELVAKAAALGVEAVAAISAPSTAAIDLAERLGITLIGFLRRRSMNVYAHPDRIA